MVYPLYFSCFNHSTMLTLGRYLDYTSSTRTNASQNGFLLFVSLIHILIVLFNAGCQAAGGDSHKKNIFWHTHTCTHTHTMGFLHYDSAKLNSYGFDRTEMPRDGIEPGTMFGSKLPTYSHNLTFRNLNWKLLNTLKAIN